MVPAIPDPANLEPVTLAPMRWWDIPAVVALEAELFAGDSPWDAAMFWSELAQQHYYLAGHDPLEPSAIVAYAGLATTDDEATVQTIAVHPAYQGRGLGRRLLSALVARAGRRQIALEVRTDNRTAITLYESFGFECVGTRRGYYQPSGSDAYTMVRPA